MLGVTRQADKHAFSQRRLWKPERKERKCASVPLRLNSLGARVGTGRTNNMTRTWRRKFGGLRQLRSKKRIESVPCRCGRLKHGGEGLRGVVGWGGRERGGCSACLHEALH